MEVVQTRTGKIYVDRDRRLEFLTVGDYGKENNIKADFLGLRKEINGVEHRSVDLTKKWVATISTQKGCPMACQFCDCPKYGFYGNATMGDLCHEVSTILENEDIGHTDRFNVHFARMGEPTFNVDVLDFTEFMLKPLVESYIDARTIHPVLSTMLPARNNRLYNYLYQWCQIKNIAYEGEAGLQLSINTTSEEQRKMQFAGQSLSLKDISNLSHMLPKPVGRKYTLNFPVTKDTILDADVLGRLFNKDKFIVKITPIHETSSAISNGYDVGNCYEEYNPYKKFELPLLERGWDVIVFIPSKEEDADRITCGNALISDK